jgi:hypothetical protein
MCLIGKLRSPGRRAERAIILDPAELCVTRWIAATAQPDGRRNTSYANGVVVSVQRAARLATALPALGAESPWCQNTDNYLKYKTICVVGQECLLHRSNSWKIAPNQAFGAQLRHPFGDSPAMFSGIFGPGDLSKGLPVGAYALPACASDALSIVSRQRHSRRCDSL